MRTCEKCHELLTCACWQPTITVRHGAARERGPELGAAHEWAALEKRVKALLREARRRYKVQLTLKADCSQWGKASAAGRIGALADMLDAMKAERSWVGALRAAHDAVTAGGHRHYAKTGEWPKGWSEVNTALANAKTQCESTPTDGTQRRRDAEATNAT